MSSSHRLSLLTEALGARQRQRLEIPGFRPAAVLVPILEAAAGLELLFTVRGELLTHHAGQIAFPGGGCDPGESMFDAARRETREEIGLEVPASAVLGLLDDHPSPARFIATPVVARLPWPQPLSPNPSEVAEVFSVPLDELAAIVPNWEERQLEGMTRRLHFYAWGERLIWGFTGNVVKELLEVLSDAEGRNSAAT